MTEDEDQSFEDEDNLPVENEFLIELVEEVFGEVDDYDTYLGHPEINREEFRVPKSEEYDEQFRLKTKYDITKKIIEIFDDSKSFEQQRKKYRLEVITSAEDLILQKSFGELKRNEREKIFNQNKDCMDSKSFSNFDKEVYFDIVESKFKYYIFLLILRDHFGDGLEESFPSKLIYSLKKYGWYLLKSHLSNDDEDSECFDDLHELISDYVYEIDMEKKFLNQFMDEEFRELFEVGHKKDWVSSN
jgi:hypothetical protein